jgi:hypothetical protein
MLSNTEGGERIYRLECEIMGFTLAAGRWEVQMDTAAAEALLSDFKGQHLDRTIESSSGLDGTTYLLLVGSGPDRITLGWWSVLPRQWREVAPFLEHLLSLAGARAKPFGHVPESR